MNLYEYIEQFKYALNLTSSDIADIMGVGQVTYENIMSGYVTASALAVERLVKALAFQRQAEQPRPSLCVDTTDVRNALCNRGRFGINIIQDNLASIGIYPGCFGIVQAGIQPDDGDILYILADGKKEGLMRYENTEGVCRLYDDNEEIFIPEAEFFQRVRVAGRLMHIAEKLDSANAF